MCIVPHNQGFVQVFSAVDSLSQADLVARVRQKMPVMSLPMLRGHELYDLGLNVFPLPYGQKSGYPWKSLRYSRLSRNDDVDNLAYALQGNCNLAVMCGRTSGNLFVIDCETPEVLLNHMAAVRSRGIPLWVAGTARGGHIYLRSSTGEVLNILSGVMENCEVRGTGGYVLAPPSLHPSGVLYEWIVREGKDIPVIDPARVNWLKDSNGKRLSLRVAPLAKGRPQVVAVSPCSPLSNKTRDYLVNGGHLPEGTRNNRLFAAACDLLGCGYSLEEVENLLLPLALASGLLNYEIYATLQSAASRQRLPSRPSDVPALPCPSRWNWRLPLLFATLHSWEGRSASYERALFLAMVERCRVGVSEHGVFRASVRELAVLARMSCNTVQRILRKWQGQKKPLVFQAKADDSSQAFTWRFSNIVYDTARRYLAHHRNVVVPGHWLFFMQAVFESDAVERGGLSKSAAFLYSAMKMFSEPMMPARLAQRCALSVNQVNYALKRLRQLGLVMRSKGGWHAVGLTVKELTAHVIGQRPMLDGRGERRRRRFADQRAAYVTRILINTRLRYEGETLRPLLMQHLPAILSREHLSEEVLGVLHDPRRMHWLAQGRIHMLENGDAIRYVAVV